MITLDNVSVSLPPKDPEPVPILKDICLEIESGEWIALVGDNGSGKTTLLKTIAGLLPISKGALDIGADPPRMSLLLQEPDNQFVATSVENELILSVPGDVEPVQRVARIEAATERFALIRFLERNPHELSGGEKQRLALATVWLAQPSVMLLDEPTAYLDAHERARCHAFVGELHAQGVTILFAAPDIENTGRATRVIQLDRGAVRFDGAPGDYERATRVDPVVTTRSERSTGSVIVSMHDVSFGYTNDRVIESISLDVREGECVGVTGRNGSGKSTLLKLLSGVLQPDGGRIERAYKKPVEDGTQNAFHLFQSPERLFFAEHVFEEIAFGLRSLGVPDVDRRDRVAAALTSVDLDPDTFMERSPFSLSFGEMRRLAFALVIALRPRLVLLDEPASCLDAAGRDTLATMIDRLANEGAAVVIASHETRTVDRVTDRWLTL